MKKSNVYLGTIKRCTNIYRYNQRGETWLEGSWRIGSITESFIHRYAYIVEEKAILIKIKDDEFIWIDMVNNVKDVILCMLGSYKKIIPIKPSFDNQLFVDKNTLVPYYKEEEKEQKTKVKKLKKCN